MQATSRRIQLHFREIDSRKGCTLRVPRLTGLGGSLLQPNVVSCYSRDTREVGIQVIHTGWVFLKLRGLAARLVLHVDLEGHDALLLAVWVPEVLGGPVQEAGVREAAGENLQEGRPRPHEVCVHQSCPMHAHLNRHRVVRGG